MKNKIHKRHIAKTVTWRCIGTIDTFLLSWMITGNPLAGAKIGLTEVVTKMVLYYLHENLWFKVKMGVKKNGDDSKKRHLAKTVSWRCVGTIDTMIIAWVITGDPVTGLKIGIAEVFTKMFLYYLHERAWYKVDYGLQGRRRSKNKEISEDNS